MLSGSVEVAVHLQWVVSCLWEHEEIRIHNVRVQPFTCLHEVVEDMPDPNCGVVDQFVVPRPNEYATRSVVSPVACVSKVVAKHLNVVSEVCEELEPEIDCEVQQNLHGNLEEAKSQLQMRMFNHG